MASKTTPGMMNGAGRRKLDSWIESFVEQTENLESPPLFRKWAAISAIATVLEQKIWLTTSSPLYPNMYIFLIGHPATGKTRTIRAMRQYIQQTPDPHIAPTSLTWASLVDALVRSKRTIIRIPEGPLEYNSMLLAPDELGTFISKYDNEMVDGLAHLFDPEPYGQERRGGDLKLKMESPQLNILGGATPTRLLEIMPESAWGQGFTSRAAMIFSDERFIVDDFDQTLRRPISADLIHDLRIINSLSGEYTVTEDYRNLIMLWREQKEEPRPNHPKLIHYASRRKVLLYKLSMISAVDHSGLNVLTREDFNRAMSWMHEAEMNMPEIFKAGAVGADSKAMDEIYHYVLASDIKRLGVSEHKIVNFARERVPAHSVMRVLEIMDRSGMLEKSSEQDPTTHQWMWRAVIKAQEG